MHCIMLLGRVAAEVSIRPVMQPVIKWKVDLERR
jgi:hypothetical protein